MTERIGENAAVTRQPGAQGGQRVSQLAQTFVFRKLKKRSMRFAMRADQDALAGQKLQVTPAKEPDRSYRDGRIPIVNRSYQFCGNKYCCCPTHLQQDGESIHADVVVAVIERNTERWSLRGISSTKTIHSFIQRYVLKPQCGEQAHLIPEAIGSNH